MRSRRGIFSESALMIVQIMKELPTSLTYTLFIDNFFSSTKLFKELRSLGIFACGTAKKGSGFSPYWRSETWLTQDILGFPPELLAFRDVANKRNHWGLQNHMYVDGVLCLSWIDNSPVQFMTTSHSIADLTQFHYLDACKRHGIPENSATPDA